ncbi:Hint domain-containing protein [Loktanella salsilacus]|uniref:Hint domain-containing protein n=1 Tax=Loktanella salsilacus TaxID=195913 RepID=UPI0037359327
MASFFARGIDVINNPSVSTNSSQGQDGAGRMTLKGGSQPFSDDAIVEFITKNETAAGELDGGSSFIGIKVYANIADYKAGIVQYNYVPQNPGQSANIQSDVSGLGDTYVRFNANELVPKTASGAIDPTAPKFGNLLVAPGSNAGSNLKSLSIDRNTDQDFNGDGVIDAGTLEDGNGKFYVGNTVPCFTPGSMIVTRTGEVAVEDLRIGDRIMTRDSGPQSVVWTGIRHLTKAEMSSNPHLQPVLIKAGAIGPHSPERDLLVSPNHRVLIAGARAELLYGESEVLVAAKHLVNGKNIIRACVDTVSYIHIMCARHEIVLSNGAWTESFQPGREAILGLGQQQRDEIFELFPQLAAVEGISSYAAARMSLKRHEAGLLRRQ